MAANYISDRAGQQLGNYQLLRLLGQGGFAEVYLGEHVYLKTQAAIKVLHTQLSNDDQESFLAEARIIARLKHPNIIQVLEFGVENSIPFLVMDYAPNGSLRQRYSKGSHLTPAIVLPYVRQVADALQYAHGEKVIHRDIKPENILLGPNNEVLLSDFGIAVGTQSSRSQNMEDIAGTAAYMAPEMLQGKPSPASDQYALGIVIYEWLSGDFPFHGSFTEIASQQVLVPPPPLKIPSVSSEVENVVMTALAKDPYQRFASMQAFANAFEQASLLEEETFRVRPGLQDELETVLAVGPNAETTAPTILQAGTETVRMSENNAQTTYPTILQTKPTLRELQQRRGPARNVAFLLIALAAVVVIASGLAYYTTVLRPAILHSPTAQATATATALQHMYTQDTRGTPILNDSLSQNGTSKWTVYQTKGFGSCAFTGGALHAISSQLYQFQDCSAQATNFSNFAYQVQMTIVAGNEGGLFFRFNNKKVQLYIFSIKQDGSYSFLVQSGSILEKRIVIHILLHRPSSAIKTGLNQANLLTVIARESRIYLYVNKQYIADVRDDTAAVGSIGVFANDDGDSTDVAFSNVQVWRL